MSTTMTWVFIRTVSGHEKGKNEKNQQGFKIYGSGWNENGRESTVESPLDVTNGGIANSEQNKISQQVLSQSLTWRLNTHSGTTKIIRQKNHALHSCSSSAFFLAKFIHYLFYDFHEIGTIAPQLTYDVIPLMKIKIFKKKIISNQRINTCA